MRVDPSTPAPEATPFAACNLKYYGGGVLQNVQVYQINWGTHIESQIKTTMPNFYSAVVQSTYWDWLAEYNTIGLAGTTTNQGISRGEYISSIDITPSTGDCVNPATDAGCNIADSQIQSELNAQITAGHIPAPVDGCDGQNSTLYMINFNPNVSLTDPNGTPSCNPGITGQAFCAYHGTALLTGKAAPGGYFAYGVIPSMLTGGCSTGCGSSATKINNETSVASHEMVEATTDTDVGFATTTAPPLAWYANATGCGEIGDICNGQQGTVTVGATTWTVQKEYDQATHSCITTKALTPICTTAGGTGCRKCACADNAASILGSLGPGQYACTAGTAWCETDTTNIKDGLCVQCTTSSECSGFTCTKSTSTTTDDTCSSCKPLTSCPAPDNCGTIPDTCGGTVNCGTCTSPQTCAGGGTANVCGCTPLTKCPSPDNCGSISDGCGGMVSCGTGCTAPQTCAGGGVGNVCGCTPTKTACTGGQNCGTQDNGCGTPISCGTCTGNNTCGGGGTPGVCGCTALTACPSPDNCGTISNNCGGMISCGPACPTSQTCGGGGTPNVCGGCVPTKTMCTGTQNCGTQDNGCGVAISCGTCTGTNTCGGGGTPGMCGCTAATACTGGQNCGTQADGCGGMVACGTCSGSNTCGGGGTPGVCGCTPTKTQCTGGAVCGTQDNGCGTQIPCGSCFSNQTCDSNQHCVNNTPDSGVTDSGTGGNDSGTGGQDSGTGATDSGTTSHDSGTTGGNDSGTGGTQDSGTGGTMDSGTGGNHDSGTSGGSDSGSTSADSGNSADGASEDGSGDGGGGGNSGNNGGCGCVTAGASEAGSSPALLGLGVLVVIGGARIRRRRKAA